MTLKQESGFTLIELLVTTAILAVLTGLAVISFKTNTMIAEYTRGEATMRTAKTALNAGLLDLPEGYALDFTSADFSGTNLSGELATAFPGFKPPDKIQLSAEVDPCDESSSSMDRNSFVVLKMCRINQAIEWQKFCGGTEVTLSHVSISDTCA